MAACPVPSDVTIEIDGVASSVMILEGQSIDVTGSVTFDDTNPDCTVDLLWTRTPPGGASTSFGTESQVTSGQEYTKTLLPVGGPGQYQVAVRTLYKNDDEDVTPSLQGPFSTLTLWVRSADEVAGVDAGVEVRSATAGVEERSADAEAEARSATAGVSARSVEANVPSRDKSTGFSGS